MTATINTTWLMAVGLRLLANSAIGICLLAVTAMQAWSDRIDPAWQPQATEKLVKLPANYLSKSLDNDFAQSELGQALREVENETALKLQTLKDMQDAADRADGDVRTELRHQFLAEKKQYLELMSRRQALERRHLETRLRLLEQLVQRTRIDAAGSAPQRVELIARQESARKRFDASLGQIDVNLLKTSVVPESRYAREYARNVAAIDTLMRAVKEHPANAEPILEGQTLSREDYLRHLMADTQAAIELVSQSASIVGYMAKLVALDATALSGEVRGIDRADTTAMQDNGDLSSAIGFFVRK